MGVNSEHGFGHIINREQEFALNDSSGEGIGLTINSEWGFAIHNIGVRSESLKVNSQEGLGPLAIDSLIKCCSKQFVSL